MSASDRHRVAVVFGAVLRTARQGAGLSQEAFAHDAGMDRTYPSLLERGRRQPTLAMLIAIANALKIEPAILVTMAVSRLRREAS
jgi:transcriptional regulator with XRE-family HTH domain